MSAEPLGVVEIVPHPIRGTKEIGSERIVLLACEVRAAEGATDERPIVEITSTSGGEDRHGSTITSAAWDDEVFMRTGHVLWQHDMVPAYPYVGKKLSSRVVGDKAISTIELLVGPWRHMNCNLPAFLWEAYRDFNMGAMSRAFIPRHWNPRKAQTVPNEFAENVEYDEVEQTEESFVNVPSNRDSFARGMERARIAGSFNDSLARVLGYDVQPYVIRTAPTEVRMSIAPGVVVQQFRSTLAEVLTRCCGCDVYREPAPEAITDEEKATELTLLNELATSLLTVMDVGLRGWKATVSTQRNLYSNVVVDSMYRIEGLIYSAKEWYGADLSITVPEFSTEDLTRIASAGGAETVGRVMRTARRASITPEVRTATRAKIAEQLRCCGCDPYQEEPPTLPTDQAVRDVEIQILRDIADFSMTQVEIGMQAWTTAETDRLRNMAQTLLMDGMWRFDSCVHYLSEWYGEEIDGAPAVDMTDVARALDGFQMQRAGAVFAKKNLDRIDQVITIMGELRAAANKPTADDVPAEDSSRAAKLAQFISEMPAFRALFADIAKERMAGPFDYASAQVNLKDDVAQQVLALGAAIPDDALAEKGRETDPHVTAKFGIDPTVTVDQLKEALANSDSFLEMAQRGGTMTLGKTAMFAAADKATTDEPVDHDVVYVAVDSPDLIMLNTLIAGAVTTVDTQSAYVPHITLAYVKAGEGQSYVGDATLDGTVVTFDSIAFSDTEGNIVDIPLAGASAARSVDKSITRIRIVSGETSREQDAPRQTIRLLVPDASPGRGDESPTPQSDPFYVRVLRD